MRIPALVLALATLAAPLVAASQEQVELSEQERQILLATLDRNHDGQLDDKEKAKALGRADRNDDGVIAGKEAEQLKRHAQALLLKAWFKAVGDMNEVKDKGATDKVRVMTTHSLPCEGWHRAYVLVRWGDLDNEIKGGGKEHYSNWDGVLEVKEGAARVVKELAFEDGHHREPGPGRGADKLVRDRSEAQVTWKAGVVGATDGLLIRLDLPYATGEGVIETGGLRIPFTISPTPSGVTLPNGKVTK